MSNDRIDFISVWCDRWCERCAFTSRCSDYAATCAIAMCGDVQQGLELAVGRPLASEPDAQQPEPPLWLAELQNAELSQEEMEQFAREQDACHARVEATTVMTLASAYGLLAWRWLRAETETWGRSRDPVINEALEVLGRDSTLIPAKLYRALTSRERRLEDDHPIQNDANGSAKVALISIERSEAAWRALAHVTGGDLPLLMADHLAQLRAEVDREFPAARRFHRPGFDDEPADGATISAARPE